MNNAAISGAFQRNSPRGFTPIETLAVVAILGILASIAIIFFADAPKRARDARRKHEITQFGQILVLSCYLPDGGPGEYDLVELAQELVIKYPQHANALSQIPRDPRAGTAEESKYIYTVNNSEKCALYANLERGSESVTLPTLTVPTPGGGTGVLAASSSGWNGSNRYFQVSN